MPFGKDTDAETATIRERMTFYRARAVSLAVIDNFAIVAARAYYSDEVDGSEVGTSTMFQAASISKPVTAMAVMKLLEQRNLTLDESVNERLISWKISSNQFTERGNVTIRHLLSHTASATVSGFPGYVREQPLPDLLQILDRLPPANTEPIRIDAAPGAACGALFGRRFHDPAATSSICKTPFPALMRDAVLDPLRMSDSTFDQPLPEIFLGPAAPGGLASGDVLHGMSVFIGNGSSGVVDDAFGFRPLRNRTPGFGLGKSNRVLSSTTSDLMLTPHSIVPADLGDLPGIALRDSGFSSMAKNVRDGSVIPAEMLDTSPI